MGPVRVTRDQKHTDQYVSGCFVTQSRGTEINIELQPDWSVSAAASRQACMSTLGWPSLSPKSLGWLEFTILVDLDFARMVKSHHPNILVQFSLGALA